MIRFFCLIALLVVQLHGNVWISTERCTIEPLSSSADWEKLPYKEDTVYNLTATGIYRVSGVVVHTGWDDSIVPTLYIAPSPFPLVVSVNGVEIYRWGDLDKSATLANFSAESIPIYNLVEGENYFTITFYSDGQSIQFPRFYIGDYNSVSTKATIQTFLNLWMIQAISVMAFFAFLLFLGYAAATGFKDRDILFFSLFALSVFLGYIPFNVNGPTINDIFWFKVSRIGLINLILFIHLFTSEFTDIFKHRLWRVLLAVNVIIGTLFIIEADVKSQVNEIFSIYSIFYVLPLLFLNEFMLVKSAVKQKRSVLYIVLAGYTTLVLAGLYDIYFILLQREPYFWTTPYGYFGLILTIVTAVTLRFHLVFKDLLRYKAELVYTNQSLVEAHNRSSQEALAKEQFIRAIAHEFRTPLNGMVGSVQSLVKDSNLPESALKKAILLSSSFNRFELIVQNLLDYQAIKSGEFEIVARPFSPNAVIENVLDYCRDDALVKGISLISLVVPEALPQYLVGDAQRLGLVVNNLVQNAIKFTKNGGVSVKCVFENGILILEVTDTGCGISDDLQDVIFKAFQRGENLTFTQQYEGVGLGLSMVDAIIKKMDGRITFRSTVEKGSSFKLEIPLQIQNVEMQKHESEIRVLVVDDNRVNRSVAVLQLEKLKYQTAVASNGEEAVQKCRNDYFDIVLMDVQMPIMDGLEATRHIKKMNPELPIIGVTANASSCECLESGMDDVLFKPTTAENFEQIISEYVKEKKDLP